MNDFVKMKNEENVALWRERRKAIRHRWQDRDFGPPHQIYARVTVEQIVTWLIVVYAACYLAGHLAWWTVRWWGAAP